MTERYRKVGLTRDRLDPEYTETKIAEWSAKAAQIGDNTDMRKELLVTHGNCLVLEYFFLDQMEEAANAMDRVLDYAEDYFFGDWRDRVPSGNHKDQPPSWRYQAIHSLWCMELTTSLVWCACRGDWQRAKKFATYPCDEIQLDPDQSPENRAWLLYLCGVLTGRTEGETAVYVASIEGGKRKREKLLLAFLQAILGSDDSGLKEAVAQYLKYYKGSESKSQDLTKKVALDGTFLVHYASYCGQAIKVPENVSCHLIPSLLKV